MRLYLHSTGPMMKYSGGQLHVSDLNPEIKTQWRISRWEMLLLAWRCLLAGLRR